MTSMLFTCLELARGLYSLVKREKYCWERGREAKWGPMLLRVWFN